MKAHIFSETAKMKMNGQGVHSAYLDLVEILKEKKEVEIIVDDKGKGDIFHSQTYGPYYFWLGRRYKGRRVLTVHVIPDSIKGSLPLWKLWYPLVKWYLKKVYNYADVCIAISPMVEKAIIDLEVKTRIVRICNPLHLERWHCSIKKRKSGRQFLKLSEEDFMIIGVGQLQARKGIEDFIEIAKACPHLKFVWVGGRPFGLFTEGIVRINNKIAKAPKNIQFTGIIDFDKMPEMYAAADMMLFTSYQENSPLAPIEAAACGKPVIYRDLKEYTLLYEYPYLKAKINREFIELIKRLKTDVAFYKEARHLSFNLIKQFEKEEISDKILKVYLELII